MPLTWNGVTFQESQPTSGPVSPQVSIAPRAESRLTMAGYFDWQDVIRQPRDLEAADNGFADSNRASRAFLGWCQTATGFQPLIPPNQPPNTIAGQPRPDPNTPYFNYTLPLSHPDFPYGFYLCDSFDAVRGVTPLTPAIGPNSTAVYKEAHTTLHFVSPKNGYRVFDDFLLIDNSNAVNGSFPRVPREFFCTRNMEIVEPATVKSQTIPGDAGLRFRTLAAGGAGGPVSITLDGNPAPGVGDNTAAAAKNFITLHEGEITIVWYPVPIAGYNEVGATDLVGKTNDEKFPPDQPMIGGIQAPRSFLTQKFPHTLVWGQPAKEIIHMGNLDWAFKITFRLKWYPFGANSFFWWNPPRDARGRIRIDPVLGPVADPALGGPGYYQIRRPDNSRLFPAGSYRAPFRPAGAAF